MIFREIKKALQIVLEGSFLSFEAKEEKMVNGT
jgi:hypothetical protein